MNSLKCSRRQMNYMQLFSLCGKWMLSYLSIQLGELPKCVDLWMKDTWGISFVCVFKGLWVNSFVLCLFVQLWLSLAVTKVKEKEPGEPSIQEHDELPPCSFSQRVVVHPGSDR